MSFKSGFNFDFLRLLGVVEVEDKGVPGVVEPIPPTPLGVSVLILMPPKILGVFGLLTENFDSGDEAGLLEEFGLKEVKEWFNELIDVLPRGVDDRLPLAPAVPLREL